MPPRRKQRSSPVRDAAKHETRTALIQAGFVEFLDGGFDAPSLDAICARAGYTRGAFYVHFKDREEFVVAVMDSVLGGFLDAIIATDAAAEGGDLEETVMRFARALIEGNALFGERGSMRAHQLLEACARSEPIRAQFVATLHEGIRRVHEAARQGQDAGSVRDDVDAETLATTLVALALGVLQMFELGLAVNLEALRATALRLLKPAQPRRR